MKTLGKVILIAVAISAYMHLFETDSSNKITKNKLQKKDRVDQAMSQELLMTADPSSNKIPKRKVLKAQKYMHEMSVEASTKTTNLFWEERGPNNVGGRTRAILFDKNDPSGKAVFAAGVSGGLWKSSNVFTSNPNWKYVNDFFGSLAICALAQDPSESNVMYFGTGEGYFEFDSNPGVGIYRSLDGGDSWGYLNATSNDQFSYIQDIQVDGNGAVYAATKSGLFKSTNKGNTWTRKLGIGKYASSDNINKIIIGDNGSLYVTSGLFDTDGIYKSTDQGNSWSKLTSGLPVGGYSRIELAQAQTNENVLYALYADANDSSCLGIYRTDDGGTSWQEVTNPPAEGIANFARTQAWYNLTIAVSPNNEDEVIIGGIDLLKSNDGGETWNQLSSWLLNSALPYMHPDQHVLQFNPTNPNELLVGNDGGIWSSGNAQAVHPSFVKRNKGYNITQFYGVAAHPDQQSNYFLAGAQDNGTQKFNTSGINNTEEVSGGDGVRCFIDEDDPQIQITSYVHNNYFVSVNGGQTFNYVPLNNFGFFANPNCYDSNNNILYASSSAGNILRWKNPENLASSFQHIIVTALSNQQASFIKQSPNIPNRLYIGTADGDIVYIDGANAGIFNAGSKIMDSDFGFVSSIDVQVGNEDHIIMSYSNYGMTSIYETTDGGATWSSIEENLPDVPVRYVMFNPLNTAEIFCATEIGVWSRTDDGNGSLWTPQNFGLANVRVDQLLHRPSDNLLIAATHGRGLFTSTSLLGLAVPVEIISFDINLERDRKSISLDWIVGQEINVEKYVIQQSFDGSVWDEIGEVAAIDSPSERHLHYEDRNLYIKDYNYYYRIMVVDRDGSVKYSDIESIYLDGNVKNRLISIYPNPFTSGIFLDMSSSEIPNSDISISDYKGTIVETIAKTQLSDDFYIEMSAYPNGVYILSYMDAHGKKVAQRVLKQSSSEEE